MFYIFNLIVGIGKVYFGCRNERFGGCGTIKDINIHAMTYANFAPFEANILSKHYENEAIILLRKFYLCENENAPKAKVKSRRVLKIPDAF